MGNSLESEIRGVFGRAMLSRHFDSSNVTGHFWVAGGIHVC
jgi:hypothetical protein